MSKIEIAKNAFVYPMPMVVVGTVVAERPNFMAVGWVSRVNFNPPLIAVALGKPHYTNGGIRESGAFSVNVPGRDLLEKVDYSGLVSGRNVDKSGLFTVVQGPGTGAPMIEECPVCMECRLVQVVDLPTNELFIGEIVGAYADEGCCAEGSPDIEKIRPFTLTMPDNRYWAVGAEAGKAWGAGKRLKG
ncbi:MAG TPA: flavin reductase family protein [Deltaproteobacteria bacterium]|nr:flavin reductase family protein [Deltaproteobacteria bacterium]HPR55611.1 flavin reductase family protein [Deltaproteobacteria bacterium]HXK48303.1 flavin reductase family protein [Deltaproteobacteria bacterium]